MANPQLPGQIEPIADIERRTTPLWFAWFHFLQVTITALQSMATTLLGPWDASFVPAVTAQTGGPPTATASCRFRKVGKTVNVSFDIILSAVGSSAGLMRVALPVTPAVPGAVLFGREQNVNGKAVTGSIVGTSLMDVVNYDNSVVWVAGTRFIISGTYETA